MYIAENYRHTERLPLVSDELLLRLKTLPPVLYNLVRIVLTTADSKVPSKSLSNGNVVNNVVIVYEERQATMNRALQAVSVSPDKTECYAAARIPHDPTNIVIVVSLEFKDYDSGGMLSAFPANRELLEAMCTIGVAPRQDHRKRIATLLSMNVVDTISNLVKRRKNN